MVDSRENICSRIAHEKQGRLVERKPRKLNRKSDYGNGE